METHAFQRLNMEHKSTCTKNGQHGLLLCSPSLHQVSNKHNPVFTIPEQGMGKPRRSPTTGSKQPASEHSTSSASASALSAREVLLSCGAGRLFFLADVLPLPRFFSSVGEAGPRPRKPPEPVDLNPDLLADAGAAPARAWPLIYKPGTAWLDVLGGPESQSLHGQASVI